MRRLRQQTRSICENGGSLRTLCWAKRSEEHTSELQSRLHLVCRLLLEKKKKKRARHIRATAKNKNNTKTIIGQLNTLHPDLQGRVHYAHIDTHDSRCTPTHCRVRSRLG